MCLACHIRRMSASSWLQTNLKNSITLKFIVMYIIEICLVLNPNIQNMSFDNVKICLIPPLHPSARNRNSDDLKLQDSIVPWKSFGQICSARVIVNRNLSLCDALYIFNLLTAKLFNLNFHPLEVVSRWRDPQLQVSENYSDLTKWRSTLFKSYWLVSHFILNIFEMWYLMC